MRRISYLLALLLSSSSIAQVCSFSVIAPPFLVEISTTARVGQRRRRRLLRCCCSGWVQNNSGEWEWEEEEGPNYSSSSAPSITTTSRTTTTVLAETTATPKLPAGRYKPKQSLGQNYLQDPNTVAKIIRAFDQDAAISRKTKNNNERLIIVELGPGAGAITDKLVETYGVETLRCIEIDARSVELLRNKHPGLTVQHEDVLQVDYPAMADELGQPLTVVGNLPYYITSQILFALADAAHQGAVQSATVTMQWEVAQRIVASTRCKDYGILSVVFQLYTTGHRKCHFKIPPTVFYPQPKVDSALVGLHFVRPTALRQRLAGVNPVHLRRVVTTTFQQRRKTVRNSLKKLCKEVYGGSNEKVQEILNATPLPLPASVQKAADAGNDFALQQALPVDWASKRPEELTPGQFVELTRLIFGPAADDGSVSVDATPLPRKVWRKLKHGV